MTDTRRISIAVTPEVHAIFKRMSDAAGLSMARTIGEWLSDTADGAQFVAGKMEEAKASPGRVMREMQAMLHGAQGEVAVVLEGIRSGARGIPPRSESARGGPAAAPSSNTGRKYPPRDKTGGVKS